METSACGVLLVVASVVAAQGCGARSPAAVVREAAPEGVAAPVAESVPGRRWEGLYAKLAEFVETGSDREASLHLLRAHCPSLQVDSDSARTPVYVSHSYTCAGTLTGFKIITGLRNGVWRTTAVETYFQTDSVADVLRELVPEVLVETRDETESFVSPGRIITDIHGRYRGVRFHSQDGARSFVVLKI